MESSSVEHTKLVSILGMAKDIVIQVGTKSHGGVRLHGSKLEALPRHGGELNHAFKDSCSFQLTVAIDIVALRISVAASWRWLVASRLQAQGGAKEWR